MRPADPGWVADGSENERVLPLGLALRAPVARQCLRETSMIIGSEINIRHFAPTPVGRTVVATACVIEVIGRSVLFAVEAHDGVRKVGEGTHRRGAVNLESFGKRLAADA
jgi:predicted thioesterase